MVTPLFRVLFRLSFVLPATRSDVVSIRHDVFSMIVDFHPPFLSLLITFICDSLAEVGEDAVSLINHLPFNNWRPLSKDIALIQGFPLNVQISSNFNTIGFDCHTL